MVGRLATRAVAAISALSLAIVVATSTPAAAALSNVTITSSQCGGTFFCYKPSSLMVTDGGMVKWTDTTGVSHTVTRCTAAACSGTGPGSGTGTLTSGSVAPNGTLTRTFNGTGIYNYYCTIHGFATMHGSITVKAPK
jgi:plastocyanin